MRIVSFLCQSRKVPATLATACFMMISQTSLAQECDAIIKHGLQNINITKGNKASIATKYFNHCTKDYSSYDSDTFGTVEVEVFGYGGGGGQLSLSQRKKSLLDWCKTNKEIATANEELYEESRMFYADAVEAWSKCNSLKGEKIQVETEIVGDKRQFLSVSLRYTGSATPGPKFYGTRFSGFSCSTTVPTGSGVVVDPVISEQFTPAINNQAINIRCTRSDPRVDNINGQEYKVYPSAFLLVQSASSPFQIYFSEEYSPSLPEERRVYWMKSYVLFRTAA